MKKIWVELNLNYSYFLSDDENSPQASLSDPILVQESWWRSYLEVQRNYFLMQQFAATLAGYDE